MPTYQVTGWFKGEWFSWHIDAKTAEQAEDMAWSRADEIDADPLAAHIHSVVEV